MCAYLQYKEHICGINFGQVREYSKSSVENATKVIRKKEKNRILVRKQTCKKQNNGIDESMCSEVRMESNPNSSIMTAATV